MNAIEADRQVWAAPLRDDQAALTLKMAAVGTVDDLVSLLDGQLSSVQAATLLQGANGCIETAIAHYFASAAETGVNEGAKGDPQSDTFGSKLQMLKSMLPHVADATLRRHLKAAKGSVDRAADAYFGAQLEGTMAQPAVEGFGSRVEGGTGSQSVRTSEQRTAGESAGGSAADAMQNAMPPAAMRSAGKRHLGQHSPFTYLFHHSTIGIARQNVTSS